MAFPSGALLIGDERRSITSEGTAVRVNPATGEPLAEFSRAGPADVDGAVKSAREAFSSWRSMPPDQRRALLRRFSERIIDNADDLAEIGSLEGGIPITFSRFMAARAASYLDYYAGWADKIEGRVIPVFPGSGLDYTLPEPYGVVGALTSWNGHSGILQKTAAALATGNCVVVKPSDLSPFSALRYGELALEAGIPPGVFNVIPGGAVAGSALAEHPGVDKLTLTGGRTTAVRVMATATSSLTPLLFELGGKSASVIFGDANLEQSVSATVKGGLGLSGQGCVNPTRLLVEEKFYAQAVECAQQVIASLRVGDPLDADTELGPVISQQAMDRILATVAHAATTCRLIVGGQRLAEPGWFVAPTLLADVDPASEIAQHEIFGPVLTMMPFQSEADAIAIANGTDYGLAGYVFTSDLDRAHRVARALEASYVSVNAVPGVAVSTPFGGSKQSGFGREGGEEGLREFLRTKNIFVAQPSP